MNLLLQREIEQLRRRIEAEFLQPSAAAWRRRLRRRWRDLLLGTTSTAPLPSTRPRTLGRERRDGYELHMLRIGAEPAGIPAHLLVPDSARFAATPAALCIHGNVPGAKDEVAGETFAPAARRGLRQFHDDYARQLAQRGVMTLVIDQPLQGERTSSAAASSLRQRAQQFDAAVMAMLAAGSPYLGRCAADQLLALRCLLGRAETDRSRIAAVGFSMGGTLAATLAALEPRVTHVVVSGYIPSYHERFATVGEPSAALNYVPGMLRWLDLPHAIALAAPTPMLLVAEARGRAAAEQRWLSPIRQAYRAMGSFRNLTIWRPPVGPHRFHAEPVVAWLARQFGIGSIENRRPA